ncbi:MAG: hypothetical protein ABII64_05240 [Elusimicrobiota bacterium]
MNDLKILQEPKLQFRYGQMVEDPHDGLTLFGPYDSDMSSHPKVISYGVVGTRLGIDALQKWVTQISGPISPELDQNTRIWPPFPGYSAAFLCEMKEPVCAFEVDSKELATATHLNDPNKRVFEVVNLYLKGFEAIQKKDESFACMICVVPDMVFHTCRTQSHIKDGIGHKISKKEKVLRAAGNLDFFELYEPEQYLLSIDFRRQLKARAMQYGIPLQIIQESTLRGGAVAEIEERNLTYLTDRAWNLGTTLYYKAGGKPWRLPSAREGVCYIGIAFRRTTDGPRTACCAAQMFLDSGDGIVFLGEYGPWYSPEKHQFHLKKDSAKKLLEGVLNTYKDLEGKELKEIFLHSRSTIDSEEYSGYLEACPKGIKLAGVRVRQERFGVRLYREGEWPVIRGSFLKINEKTCYLWASGFKQRLATYDGWDVPVPLRIDIEHGERDIEKVAKDILSLTKLNYNACKLGDSEPVTVAFSDAVGEILVSNPTVKERRPNFKFYI